MLNAARLTLLALAALPTDLVLANDDAWGRWHDDGGANTYEFLGNHEFQFVGFKKVWIEHRGFASTPLANLPRAREPRGQYMQQRIEFSGAWETGENVCTSTVPGLGKVTGNLKIYAGSVECCMEAKRLGPTLVLRALRSDTPAADKADGPEICANRALRQDNEETK
jgi:hypothetical protein